MAGKHLLEGLIKWSTRERWADWFEEVLADHLAPTCDETGLEINEIVAILGEDLFTSTVWACAFEDFLTREFDDDGNAIDDYLSETPRLEGDDAGSHLHGRAAKLDNEPL